MGLDWAHGYEVKPEAFWDIGRMDGDDGYDAAARAEGKDVGGRYSTVVAKVPWAPVYSWGRDGWDMLSAPYYILYWRTLTIDSDVFYQALTNCEGDVNMWSFPTPALRERHGDELAFFGWKNHGDEWVSAIESADQMPERLRGPFSWKRLDGEAPA
jgi:hypothetical protein